jgi:hypothetical protein
MLSILAFLITAIVSVVAFIILLPWLALVGLWAAGMAALWQVVAFMHDNRGYLRDSVYWWLVPAVIIVMSIHHYAQGRRARRAA